MRIALVSPGYPPTRGGVEMVVAQTARALVRAGAQVEVLTDERCWELPRVSYDKGVLVRRFDCNQARNYRIAPALWRYVGAHSGDYDVVHGHGYHAPTAVGAALGLRAAQSRTPFVFSPHYHGTGHSRARALLHHFYRPVGRVALDLARSVVCVSKTEAELIDRHFPAFGSRTVVVPNAVDTAALRAASPFEGEPPTILGVGRLEGYKRFDLLVEAFGRLVHMGVRSPSDPITGAAQLVIIGDGPERPRLEEAAARLGVKDRVRVLRHVSDDELHGWLHTAQVLCSLSEHEAYGLAPAEALVAGTRVVLSAIPAHREMAAAGAVGAVELVQADSVAVARALESVLVKTSKSNAEAVNSAVSLGVGVLDWDDVATSLITVYQAAVRSHPRMCARW
jgi:glycosyltransferase involved in cell wall biosynthesis